MTLPFNIRLANTSSTIAIDFDGVIHNDDKGFHDGTIYGNLIDGVKDSLIYLSKYYNIVIFTCKANPNRPLVDGCTGIDLIWQWLRMHEIDIYISDVVFEKPNAFMYIDDKGYKFENWEQTLNYINVWQNERKLQQ